MAFAVAVMKQAGSVLLLTLIFCGACSLLMLLMLETSILETIMLNHSLAKKKAHLDYVLQLNTLERELDDKRALILPKNISFLQWVPDTLLFNETEGIVYYRIYQEKMLLDGTRSQFTTTYAVRDALPKGELHPNNKQYEINVEDIPLSKWLPISEVIGQVIIGKHPQGEGVLLYALAKKKYHAEHVLVIVSEKKGHEATLYKVIDLGKPLHQPLLRNNILVLNDDEFVMLFDAFTGEFLRKEPLVQISLPDPITELTLPKMCVRKPRELKRLILCPTLKGWAQAEINVDYHVLGRRTWNEI